MHETLQKVLERVLHGGRPRLREQMIVNLVLEEDPRRRRENPGLRKVERQRHDRSFGLDDPGKHSEPIVDFHGNLLRSMVRAGLVLSSREFPIDPLQDVHRGDHAFELSLFGDHEDAVDSLGGHRRTTSSSVASGKTVNRPDVMSSPTVVFSNPARTRAGPSSFPRVESAQTSMIAIIRWLRSTMMISSPTTKYM